MDESTAIEQPAVEDTIRGGLEEAMSGYDEDFNEIVESEDVEVEESENEALDVEEGEVEEVEVEEVEEPNGVAAPEHWAPEDKETFLSAPPEIKQWLLDRHKAMEGDYTKKAQEVSEIKKTLGPVHDLFAPHMDALRANGQTPASVIQGWAQWEQAINQNPQQALTALAKQYGVNLGEQEESNIDPQYQTLQQEIQQLKQSAWQREQMEAQQRQSTITQELESFAQQKTEAGEMAHPYFDDVIDDMVSLAKAEKASGRNPNVADLYDKAVWANPEVREKILAAQQSAAAKKAEQEARAKAAKAKNAQKTIKSSPDGDAVSDLSLRDMLTQMLN